MKLNLPLSLLLFALSVHVPVFADNVTDISVAGSYLWDDLSPELHQRLVVSTSVGSESTVTINSSLHFNGYILDSRADHEFYGDNGNHTAETDYLGGSVFVNTGNPQHYGLSYLTFSGAESQTKNLVFSNNSLILSSGRTTGHYGGGVMRISLAFTTFQNLNQLAFRGNLAQNTRLYAGVNTAAEAVGGALSASLLSFKNIRELIFSDNKVLADRYAGGGAVYSYGDSSLAPGLIVENAGTVTFDGNQALVGSKGGIGRGGALYIGNYGKGYETFTLCGKITFSNNLASYSEGTLNELPAPDGSPKYFEGGAIFSASNFSFQNTGTVLFHNNSVNSLKISDIRTSVTGGAIYTIGLLVKGLYVLPQEQYALHFFGNSALSGSHLDNTGASPVGGAGGALFLYKLTLRDSEDILFENNYTTGWGGAIYIGQQGPYIIDAPQRRSYSQYLYADKGDITFRGNTHLLRVKTDRDSGILNSIYFEGSSANREGSDMQVLISAAEGRAVNFYDPVASYNRQSEKLPIFLNYYDQAAMDENGVPLPGYTGTIRFSGKYTAESLKQAAGESDDDFAVRMEASRRSDINAAVQFYDGTLVLEEGVTLGRKFDETNPDKGEGMTFQQWGGTLDISNSTLAASNVYMEGSAGEYKYGNGAVIKAGAGARLESSGDVDWSRGMSFDLGCHLTANGFSETPGLLVSSGTMTVDGPLCIADKGQKLEYYENTRWKSPHTFILADITNVDSVSGDFSGIFSQLSGSDIVEGFGYNGIWSYENKDGQLLAIWTPEYIPSPEPDPEPEPEKSVHPELAGNLTINSLWSTVSNMRALSRSALGQVGVSRFLLPKNTNYWALGLGDFSSHKSIGSLDGYDYNGFGYAVGADTHLADSLIGGLAFGNIYGKNKSRNFNAHIDQASYIGLAYASWTGELDKTNSLGIDGTASYGVTSNKLDTRYSDGDVSKGKWDNDALRFTLRGEWHHSLDENWTLSPFLGIEYDQAQQKSFTETGDKTRQFGKSTLCNLALPAGLGISHRSNYSHGRQWINSLAVSYVPDIYRKNPEAATLRTTNGFTWTAEGLHPVRNAGRLEYSTRYQFNETWALFGGCSLEGRKNSFYHNANIGISAGF